MSPFKITETGEIKANWNSEEQAQQ